MSNALIMKVLSEKGYQGNYNDRLSAWAKDELGEVGHINCLLDNIACRVGAGCSESLIRSFEDFFGEDKTEKESQ